MGLLDKAKETARKGADLAKKGVEAGQEKLEETKLKKRIGDLKEELGGVVFNQRHGGGDGASEAEIDRLVREIAAAQEELAKLAADDKGS
jgi:hypothetical protein